jgi:hypothetical protein
MAEPFPETSATSSAGSSAESSAGSSAGSFSGLVTSAAWWADVEGWVHGRVSDHGHRVTGPLDQRRVCAWSTQIVVPTDVGRLWFKALCPSMAFEPALQDLLATVVPHEVDRPYAIDPRRGWMMTVDRGRTLSDSHEPTLADWCAVVVTMADLQRAIAPHRDDVLATGVQDCSPATVPARFDGLVEVLSGLPRQHPSHLDADLRAALRAARPRLVDVCAQIAASPMPSTVQHGDLHPGNVFAVDGTLRVFDFGDTQWAPALEVLSVPHGILAEEGRWPWRPVIDAYAEQWADVIDVRALNAMWGAVAFTRPVNRSLTWWNALAGATEEEWAEWGVAPLHHLRRILEA